MTFIIRVLIEVSASTPNSTAYAAAPCAFQRGEPSWVFNGSSIGQRCTLAKVENLTWLADAPI